MKILVVEDFKPNIEIIKSIVESTGHECITAVEGKEAIKIYMEQHPDLILLDVELPKFNGYEIAKKIRELEGSKNSNKMKDWTPIIFLSVHDNDDDIVKGIKAGGDDYITKPISPQVVTAKIHAMERISDMRHQMLQMNSDLKKEIEYRKVIEHELELQNASLVSEQEAAKEFYDKLILGTALRHPKIKYKMAPASIFNGDVLLAYDKNDSMHLLMGDFTGHGLQAALGIMPIADTFHYMFHKEHSIEEIVSEINDKLNSILPIGTFCSLCYIAINWETLKVSLFNAAFPPIIYLDTENNIETYQSTCVPLGVQKSSKLHIKENIVEINLKRNDKLFIYSDGLIEAINKKKEMFGMERVLKFMKSDKDRNNVINQLLSTVETFSFDNPEPVDDISIVEITG